MAHRWPSAEVRVSRERTTESYFLANRSLPWWAVGLSVMATQLSAITMIGTTGQGYADGMRFLQFYFALPLAMVVLSKGKIWTGLVGLFFAPLLWVGALRLSRPAAPWARARYAPDSRKMARSLARERKVRRPVVRAKVVVQNLVAGAPTLETVRGSVENSKVVAEEVLDREVHPALPPPSISPPAASSGTIDGLPR